MNKQLWEQLGKPTDEQLDEIIRKLEILVASRRAADDPVIPCPTVKVHPSLYTAEEQLQLTENEQRELDAYVEQR
jgi:hypothetical protein